MGDKGTHKQGDQGGKSYPLAQGKPRNISQWLVHHNAIKEEGPVTNCRKNFPMKVVERIGDYRLYLVCNKVTLSPDRGGVLAQTWKVTKAEAYHWDHRVKSQSREGKPTNFSSAPHLPHQQGVPRWNLAKAASPCQSLWVERLLACATEQNGHRNLRIPCIGCC